MYYTARGVFIFFVNEVFVSFIPLCFFSFSVNCEVRQQYRLLPKRRYFGRVALDWQLMVSFMVAASLGIAAGAYLVRFIRAKHLQKAFGYFLLFMAAFILWQNRTELRSPQTSKPVSSAHSKLLLHCLEPPLAGDSKLEV